MPHSPAPWSIDSSPMDGNRIVDANGDPVVGFGWCEGSPSGSPIDNPDDWPLIVAAPELLHLFDDREGGVEIKHAHLNNINIAVSLLRRYAGEIDIGVAAGLEQFERKARAAIAKATKEAK